uniref:Uncharacterized protein n=1 Tax=Rhipicephalus zambeziensis TaxID=60191 RepID=A0A224YEJ7_9ACAR
MTSMCSEAKRRYPLFFTMEKRRKLREASRDSARPRQTMLRRRLPSQRVSCASWVGLLKGPQQTQSGPTSGGACLSRDQGLFLP